MQMNTSTVLTLAVTAGAAYFLGKSAACKELEAAAVPVVDASGAIAGTVNLFGNTMDGTYNPNAKWHGVKAHNAFSAVAGAGYGRPVSQRYAQAAGHFSHYKNW